MIKTVSASQVKNNFGTWIKQVYQTGDHLIVEKSGIPVVVIIPIADYRQLLPQSEQGAPDLTEKLKQAGNLVEAIQDLQKNLHPKSNRETETQEKEKA